MSDEHSSPLPGDGASNRGYADQAANERTFLAWVRTGIAIIALGFVIEKFKLFVLMLAVSQSIEVTRRLQIERLATPLGRYGGLVLVYGGLALILIATVRFVRISRLLAHPKSYASRAAKSELFVLIALLIAIAGFAVLVAAY